MNDLTRTNLESLLGKIFRTRQHLECFLKTLKDKDEIFSSIVVSFQGKPKSNIEIISDIVKCRPNAITDPNKLLAWMVEVFHHSHFFCKKLFFGSSSFVYRTTYFVRWRCLLSRKKWIFH